MVQNRKKGRGIQSGTNGTLPGVELPSPPPSNTGGKPIEAQTGESHHLVTDRLRINLSPPEGVYRALEGAARSMGATVAQIALQAIMAGLPSVSDQTKAIDDLKAK